MKLSSQTTDLGDAIVYYFTIETVYVTSCYSATAALENLPTALFVRMV